MMLGKFENTIDFAYNNLLVCTSGAHKYMHTYNNVCMWFLYSSAVEFVAQKSNATAGATASGVFRQQTCNLHFHSVSEGLCGNQGCERKAYKCAYCVIRGFFAILTCCYFCHLFFFFVFLLCFAALMQNFVIKLTWNCTNVAVLYKFYFKSKFVA